MTFLASRKASAVLGVHPNTLRTWESKNLIETIKTPSGQRLYNVNSYIHSQEKTDSPSKFNRINVLYARVSSKGQSKELNTQIEFLKTKYPHHNVIKDIGSGLNYKRAGFKTILDMCLSKTIGELVVTHKDRLCRFGFDIVDHLVKSSGGKIVVLNNTASFPQEEMVQDIISIIHVFSSRLYGLRKYKTQIKTELNKPQQCQDQKQEQGSLQT